MKFKSLGKKIATVGLAGAMMMSMAMPVFAAPYNNGTDDTNDDVNAVTGYTITKEVDTATGVDATSNIAAKTFTFKIEAGTKEEDTTVTSPKPAGAATVTGQTYYTATVTGAGSTSDIFTGTTFDSPGVYDYTISEIAGTDDTNNWTYDDTSYTVRVKVVAGDNGNEIAAVTAQNSKTNNKDDSIKFNNDYTAWGDDEGEDTPGTLPTALTVSKKVSGSGFSDTDQFSFSITFDGDALADKTKVPTSSAGGTITYGTAYTFTLTKDGSITFSIPAGVKYTVKETDSKGAATTTYKLNSDSAVKGTDVPEQTVARADADTIEFTNSSTNPLTGIVNNYGGLLMIVAIAAAGIVVISIRRRREA